MAFIRIALKAVRASDEFSDLRDEMDSNKSKIRELDNKINEASDIQKEIVKDLKELKRLYEKAMIELSSKRDSEK